MKRIYSFLVEKKESLDCFFCEIKVNRITEPLRVWAFAKRVSLFTFCLVSAVEAQSEIIAGYDFNDDSSDQMAVTVKDPQISASQLTSPMGVDFRTEAGDNSGVDADGEEFGSVNNLGHLGIKVTDATTTSFEDAVRGNDYLTFTVTPDEDIDFNLNKISFKAVKSRSISVDNYAVTDAAGEIIGSAVSITSLEGTLGEYEGVSIDLTETEYKKISKATEFRIYAWGRGSDSLISSIAGIDKVALYGEVANNNSGRNSHFWVTLKPQAGTELAVDSDLKLDNGFRSVDLSSPDLSCTRVESGSNLVYQITWTGNSLFDGAETESLDFNVVVEAFSGSDYIYEKDNATVTSLGEVTSPSVIDNSWGVEDFAVDEGDTLRMTLQDFKVGGENLAENGLEEADVGFDSLGTAEPNGGRDHKIIFGEGTTLDTVNFHIPVDISLLGLNSFVVTGAGSSSNARNWAIGEIDFSFIVRNPDLTVEDPNYYFSDIKGGREFGATPYEPTTDSKLENAYPKFSWDVVPLTALIWKASEPFTDEEAERLANRYDLVVLEKFNGNIAGFREKATALKSYNPDVTVIHYWNSLIYYGHYDVDDSILEFEDEYIDPDSLTRGTLSNYNQDNPDLIDWWAGVALKMMGLEEGIAVDGVTSFTPSSLDGTFVDKKSVPIEMLQALYEDTSDEKFIINNNGPEDRDRIAYVDGTYREGWSGGGADDDSIIHTIALAKESGGNQKVTMLRNIRHEATNEKDMEDTVDFNLATYLMYVDKYAYFMYFHTVEAYDDHYGWLLEYMDQFSRPLGEPLGDAIRDNKVFCRGFEHCDAYLDLDPASGAENLPRIMWKNNIGSLDRLGSAASKTDDTYWINGAGNISGTSDNFFYLSDLHYGDGEVIAKIDDLSGTNEDARAGIMFRARNEFANEEDYFEAYIQGEYRQGYKDGTILLPEAQMIAVLKERTGEMSLVCRAETGEAMVISGTLDAEYGPYAKLVRSGDIFTGYCSPDGETWTEIGKVDLPMNERIEMGMALASGSKFRIFGNFSEFSRTEPSKVVLD